MGHDLLKVGVICQTLVQQHHFRQITESCDLHLEKSFLIDQVIGDLNRLLDPHLRVDIWLIDVDIRDMRPSKGFDNFEKWMGGIETPIIFGEGTTINATDDSFNSWSRQLKEKLLDTSGQLSGLSSEQQKATDIWVLAASTGGPEAVKEFLDNLPIGLGIGFLYVQHIEAKQHHSLVDMITRGSQYTSQLATHGDIVCADTVTLVPVAEEIKILPSGMIVSTQGRPWRGPYHPSIDQVVANIAMSNTDHGGVIFFSGMGEDGVDGARLMSKQGGQVWIQSLASCTSDSMPKAVNQTGYVNEIGTPKQLAELLKKHKQAKKQV